MNYATDIQKILGGFENMVYMLITAIIGIIAYFLKKNKKSTPLTKEQGQPVATNTTPHFYLGVGLLAVDPNAYNGWTGELRACENDVIETAHNLSDKFQKSFLLTRKATWQNVEKWINNIADQVTPDSIIVFNYSGHGARRRIKANYFNEYLCLYDNQVNETLLRQKFRALTQKGASVIWIVDACHSGGLARQVGIKPAPEGYLPKSMPFDIAEKTHNVIEPIEAAAIGQVGEGIMLLSACLAAETALDGQEHGMFTSNFLRVILKGNNINFKELIAQTVELCGGYQTPQLKTAAKSSWKGYESIEKVLL